MGLTRNLQNSVFLKMTLATVCAGILSGFLGLEKAQATTDSGTTTLCSELFPPFYIDKKTGVTVQVPPPKKMDYLFHPLKTLQQRRLYKDAVEYQLELQEWKATNTSKVQKFYNPTINPALARMPKVAEKYFPKSSQFYLQEIVEGIQKAQNIDEILRLVSEIRHRIQDAETEINAIEKIRDELENKILSTAQSYDRKEPGLKILPQATQVALKMSQSIDPSEMEVLSKEFLEKAHMQFSEQKSLRQTKESRVNISSPDRIQSLGEILKRSGLVVNLELPLPEVLKLAEKYPAIFKMLYREVQLQRRLQKWSSDSLVHSFLEVRKENNLQVLKETQRLDNLTELRKLESLRKLVRAVDVPKSFDGIGLPQARWEKSLNFYQRELVVKDALRSDQLAVQLIQSQQSLPVVTAVMPVSPEKPQQDLPKKLPVAPEYDLARVKRSSVYRREVQAAIKKFNQELSSYKSIVNAWKNYQQKAQEYNFQLKIYKEQTQKFQQAQQLKNQVMLSLQTYFAIKFPSLFPEQQAQEIRSVWKRQSSSKGLQKTTPLHQRRVQRAVQERNRLGDDYDDWYFGNIFLSPAYMFMPGNIYGILLLHHGDSYSKAQVSDFEVIRQIPLPSDLPSEDTQMYQEMIDHRPILEMPSALELMDEASKMEVPAFVDDLMINVEVEKELSSIESSLLDSGSLSAISFLDNIAMPEAISLPRDVDTGGWSDATSSPIDTGSASDSSYSGGSGGD